MTPDRASRLPLHFGDSREVDPEVHRFIEAQMYDMGDNPFGTLTARDVLKAARKVFGDRRCIGVEYWEH
jgi:hypothetical protein